MSDIPNLAGGGNVVITFEIDPRPMEEGGKRAGAALDDVKKKAGDAEKSVGATSRVLNATFKATGGSIQVAQGISQTADAFGKLNLAAAGFGASRTLLDMGKTVQDFQRLRTAIGATGGAWSTLTGLFRASPIGVIATAIGLAATAMSLFGRSTEKTTDAVKKQTTALDGMLARAKELDIRRGYGANDPRTSASGTVDTLTQLRLSQQRDFRPEQAAALFGVDELAMRQAIGEQGVELFRDPFTGGFNPNRYAYDKFPREWIVTAGERLLEQRRSREMALADRSGPSPEDVYQFGSPTAFPFTDRSSPYAFEEGYPGMSGERAFDMAERERQRQEESARRIADIFGRVAADLGVLVADILFAGGSFRQMLAQIVRGGATTALSAGFGALGQAVGASVAQQRQDAGAGKSNIVLPP